jgi:hypothetical protein
MPYAGLVRKIGFTTRTSQIVRLIGSDDAGPPGSEMRDRNDSFTAYHKPQLRLM